MIGGFRFTSTGLRLSCSAQWKPVTRGASPHHDPNPPITIEAPAPSLVWRHRPPSSFLTLLLRSAVFFAVLYQ